MTRRGQFMPRQSMKGQGAILKRLLKFVLQRYTPHVILVVLLIAAATWCTLQGTLFTQSLIDDYITPMLRYQQEAGLIPAEENAAEASLAELFELTESAGAIPVASISQKLARLDPATCVGSGKLEEIKDYCAREDVDLIIFDLELSPVQIRNIEAATDVRVIDRTMLILDIFALRARSREGKLQVELAQLKYMMPRLTGKGVEMSRLGGGIGTRGPGESKLETDRRHIKRRMETLKEQLRDVEEHRRQLRSRRSKDNVITVAIVGYTNAGKSTLMNTLTDAGVLSEDKLFATLDPTSRALKLPCRTTWSRRSNRPWRKRHRRISSSMSVTRAARKAACTSR